MNFLENSKSYTGSTLETIFFRPMLTGSSALDLGVRVLYNMPIPTTVQIWDGSPNVLQPYTAAGWSGGDGATKLQKTIDLHRVKAELGFSAADYFSLVFENITNRSDVNMDDLTGSELEVAETTIFKNSIAEGIRATMWMGDTSKSSGFNTFDGFLKAIVEATDESAAPTKPFLASELTPDGVVKILDAMWSQADERVKGAKGDGQLAIYVTSDIYDLYEKYLDSKGGEGCYIDTQVGRKSLAYHGIEIVDLRLATYLKDQTALPKSFAILTDRRNLVLAVNTADFPGNEVRMWYNPDEMENRQRAVFMAGCELLDEALISFAKVVTTLPSATAAASK